MLQKYQNKSGNVQLKNIKVVMASDMAVSTSTSPKSSLAKLVLYPKPKAFKIAILGQSGVGKSGKLTKSLNHLITNNLFCNYLHVLIYS